MVPAPCPKCGNGMIILTSINAKWCDCGFKMEHHLKPGQKSVLIDGLVGGKNGEPEFRRDPRSD